MPDKVEDRRVWLVRAGRHGEDEDTALESGLAVIGFIDVPDLVQFKSLDALESALMKSDPAQAPKKAANRARQLWAFKSGIERGDVVVLPLKLRAGQVALGLVTGDYAFVEVDGKRRHTRKITWLRPDVPRTAFKQDLLHSFGAFMTVCRISRNGATQRVISVLDGRMDPGFVDAEEQAVSGEADSAVLTPVSDVAQAAHDEIAAFIRARFKSHDMARLVEAVLVADGFITKRSPPGPDGGIDILAGRGSLGLDAPTVCVQVKATEAPADVTVFRALQGTLAAFGASQGLLVSWSGVTQALRAEARQHAFRIQIWDQADLVRAVYRTYDRLDEEIQAELPLQRIWTLVREDIEAPE